jgi:hypothetical protein
MTTPEIRAKREKIRAQLAKLQEKIAPRVALLERKLKHLELDCPHENSFKDPDELGIRICNDCGYSGSWIKFSMRG